MSSPHIPEHAAGELEIRQLGRLVTAEQEEAVLKVGEDAVPELLRRETGIYLVDGAGVSVIDEMVDGALDDLNGCIGIEVIADEVEELVLVGSLPGLG